MAVTSMPARKRLGLASRSGDDLGIPGAVAAPCDVRDPAALESLVGATVERFGRLDILVVNAGVGAYGPFLELPPDQLEEMIDVNVKGAIYAVRAALPHLLRSDAADIVTFEATVTLSTVMSSCAMDTPMTLSSASSRMPKPAGLR
jgi:NAD(P)-dependent dehydrogenase (short-subunit alcohol dehydrogenase family)